MQNYKSNVIKVTPLVILLCFLSCTDDKRVPHIDKSATVPVSKQKILYVDSYSPEFQWIQGIMKGINEVLNLSEDPGVDGMNLSVQSRYELRTFHMESKKNFSEESIRQAARDVMALIDEWEPDVIITSDDNAARYLIVPYLKTSEIPVVFCGINWDASDYGLPTANITGMIEVNLIDKLVEELKKYSRGSRIGYIRDSAITSRKESDNYEKLLGVQIIKKYPTSFNDWKKEFNSLQDECDIVLVGYPNGLDDWDGNEEPYQNFLRENTRVPTGSWDEWTSGWVLMSFALSAEEQGRYAASAAVRILNGESPADIPVVRNREARIFLNMGMAMKLGIIFPVDLIERSHVIENWLVR